MKYKNYYKVLGLSSAKATDEEIKSAYRNLAKKYHPDLNGGDTSLSEKFKDINEAYEILGNPISRKKYDRVHFAYKFRDGFYAGNVKEKINISSGFNDFFTTFFGAGTEKNVVTNFDKYYQTNAKEVGEDLESEIDISLEEGFFGSNRKIAFKTAENKVKTIEVKIPRGIRSGEKIRLQGQGKPGKNGGKNGDFYITIHIIPHQRFQLEENNLVLDVPITAWEAALGCELDVASIDSSVFLNIPAGVQTGERLRVASAGYVDKDGNRGDLLLNMKIMVPKNLTKEEKEVFLNLKNISTYRPRSN